MATGLGLALLTGVGIAAACGLRAFLPLLAVGIGARVGVLHLRGGSEWLANDTALWALGAATVLEILGDKVPVVDHALDALGTLLRPAAAVVGTYAVLHGWGEPWAPLFSLVFGAGALAVHGIKAKARVGSSAVTLGHANPFLSALEDVTSFGLLAAAILAPLAALAIVLLLAWMARRWWRRRQTSRAMVAGGA